MRTGAILMASLFLLATCGGDDSGGETGGETVVEADDVVVPEEETSPSEDVPLEGECAEIPDCSWGEVCTAKLKCEEPDDANPMKLGYKFKYEDKCPGSETFGDDIKISHSHGQAILLFFSITNCPECDILVDIYQTMVDDLRGQGLPVTMLTVILIGQAGGLPEFVDPLHYPVVVDGMGVVDDVGEIAGKYKGSAKNSVAVLDRAGYVHHHWPYLDAQNPDNAATLKSMLVELAGEFD